MPKQFPTPKAHPEDAISPAPLDEMPQQPDAEFLMALIADRAPQLVVAECLRRRDEANPNLLAGLLLAVADAMPKFAAAQAAGEGATLEYFRAEERIKNLAYRRDFSEQDRDARLGQIAAEEAGMRDAMQRSQTASMASLGIGACAQICPAITNDPRFQQHAPYTAEEIARLRELFANWPADNAIELSVDAGGWPRSTLHREQVRRTVRLVNVQPLSRPGR